MKTPRHTEAKPWKGKIVEAATVVGKKIEDDESGRPDTYEVCRTVECQGFQGELLIFASYSPADLKRAPACIRRNIGDQETERSTVSPRAVLTAMAYPFWCLPQTKSRRCQEP
jgi:hypothetical protein